MSGGGGATSALDVSTTAAGAGAANAGHAPAIAKPTRVPAGWPGVVSTACIRFGLSKRCGEIGTSACQAPLLSQRPVTFAACSITPAASAKNASGLPCSADGRPPMATRSSLASSTSSALALASDASLGCAAQAALNSAAWPATLACAGTRSANSPCCGMHTSLHTSHCADNLTLSASPLKSGETVSATGSSNLPS